MLRLNYMRHFGNSLINNCNKCVQTAVRKEMSGNKKISESPKHMASNSIQNHYIVWVDLEMTGLNIEKDRIIEMACLITDKDLNIIAEGPDLVINQPDELLDGMDDWCRKTHGESGLTQAVRESKIDINEAERIMLSFLHENKIPAGKCPLAGNSVHVDRMFLNKEMKHFLDHLHYRIIDVSSLKELGKRWYPDMHHFNKKNPHRALEDIRESIGELKFYRSNMFK